MQKEKHTISKWISTQVIFLLDQKEPSIIPFKDTKEKFNNNVKASIKRKFGIDKTENIWVCWQIPTKKRNYAISQSKKHKITIWEFREKIKELVDCINTSNYGDDILKSVGLLKIAGFECSK